MRTFAILLGTPLLTFAKLHVNVPESTFHQLIQDEHVLLTAFASPSLSLWDTLQETLEQASTDSSIPFALVNCDTASELCKEEDIHTYPTIHLFSKDVGSDPDEIHMTRYRGPRTPQALRIFVNRHSAPILSHVQLDELETFQQKDDIVILAYLREDQTSLQLILHSVAEQHAHRVTFGYITDSAAADAAKLSVPSIVAYRAIDGDHKSLSGHFSASDVEDFLKSASVDAIKTFRERDVEMFMLRDKLTLYIFVASWEQGRQLRYLLTPLAKKYAKYVTFAMADVHEYAPMATSFGLKGAQDAEENVWPAIAVHAPVNDNSFVYKQGNKIDEGAVEAMLTMILQGKAKNGEVFEVEGHDEL